MDLFEYEGKGIFRNAGIPTPNNELLFDTETLPKMPFPFVLKAQTLTGGRGKAGGIKVCNNAEDFRKYAPAIKNMTIKGKPVIGLMAEEMVKPDRELYLSITNQGVKTPTLIACASGGMEIEKVAEERPDDIMRVELDPQIGIKGYQIREISRGLGLKNDKEFNSFIQKITDLFFNSDARLVEINPLGVFDGSLKAMDSKIVLDDHARYRHEDLFAGLEEERKKLGYAAKKGDGTTITFVPLEGEVGLISDGAGTGMLTLDMLTDAGGAVASFCELGGTTSAEVMYKAMEYTCQKMPKAILIVLIGGFNRMDDMANGITKYISDRHLDIPVVTRMCGTMEKVGIEIMNAAGLNTCSSLQQAVESAVAALKGAK